MFWWWQCLLPNPCSHIGSTEIQAYKMKYAKKKPKASQRETNFFGGFTQSRENNLHHIPLMAPTSLKKLPLDCGGPWPVPQWKAKDRLLLFFESGAAGIVALCSKTNIFSEPGFFLRGHKCKSNRIFITISLQEPLDSGIKCVRGLFWNLPLYWRPTLGPLGLHPFGNYMSGGLGQVSLPFGGYPSQTKLHLTCGTWAEASI